MKNKTKIELILTITELNKVYNILGGDDNE